MRGELRHYYFLKCLAMEHEITLVVLNRRDVSPEALEELEQCTRHLVRVGTLAPSQPTDSGLAGILAPLRWRVHKTRLFRRDLAEMKQRVERLLQGGGFDVLLLAGSDLYSIAEGIPDAPMVVDWCDTESVRLRRSLRHTRPAEWPLRLLRYRQASRVERRVFRKLRHVTFVSGRDRDAATAVARMGTVIPLGLARKSEGVVVTGTVPDLRPYLESAAAFVAPLRFASGMQNKITEAMAMELPVVTTPVVAEGFSDDSPDEPPLLVGERPRELAAHLATIIRDPLAASRLGAAGRRYVRRHCDWGRSARGLDCLCREVARTERRRLERSHKGDGRRHTRTHSTRSTDRVFHSFV